jgi:EPS-associated MarR family transcriptional regulator|tara:strand:+ start:352 stop:627 length:276 start_codon:yes stop_codon:yes gene_type:complete
MRKIGANSNLTQRDLAEELGFSLGKLNYCLRELKNKGFIKMNNFRKSKQKIKYIYVLTPGGISAKTKLTINFMKRKMKEYDELKKELDERN